jgi:hypothetical protein
MSGMVEPNSFVRAAIVMGIVVEIACTRAVSIVVSGLLGTAIGYAVTVPSTVREKQATAEKT